MKQQMISTVAAVLLFATAAMATTQSRPNYTINAGRIVSGGTASTDASGMSKTGIAIGQGVFMPPGGSSSSAYSTKPASLPLIAGGGACGIRSGDINCDGVVDIIDALLAIRTGVGLTQLTTAEIVRGDVGPLANSVSVGDGRIDIEDSILILRKAVGLGW
ncbi:MAG: hypothetical protein HXX17_14160 [Geobacteraceae bacterium]|nr:hypothetical protein [Geobacteraceae bacterium]